jgi:hypothetical protein
MAGFEAVAAVGFGGELDVPAGGVGAGGGGEGEGAGAVARIGDGGVFLGVGAAVFVGVLRGAGEARVGAIVRVLYNTRAVGVAERGGEAGEMPAAELIDGRGIERRIQPGVAASGSLPSLDFPNGSVLLR